MGVVDLRLPDISGSDKEQLLKIRSYLYQLIPQLQFALNNVGTSNSQEGVTPTQRSQIVAGSMSDANAQATFNSIKPLIIKSADIVEAYYDEINRKLEGVYVAQSDFGDYAEKTSQEIEETSASTTQRFENIQVIIDSTKNEILDDLYNTKEELSQDIYNANFDVNGRIVDTNGSVASLGSGLNDANNKIAEVDGDLQTSKEAINTNIQDVQDRVTGVNALIEDTKTLLQGSLDNLEVGLNRLNENISVTPEAVVIGVAATIKSGRLYSTDTGIPVYGIEIGQTVDVNGNEKFKKFARFTSEKLSFYDSNGYEVAYFSDKKLFIKMAEITVSFQIGKLIDLVMDNGDVVTKWVGG